MRSSRAIQMRSETITLKMYNSLKLLSYSTFVLILVGACSEKDQSEVGDQYYKSGEYQKAITSYTEFLALKPVNEIALYNRGRAYEEMGNYILSLKDFQRVLVINPKSENAYLSIGKDFYRQDDYENAAFNFEKAYKLNTKNAQAALLVARANHKFGEIDLAMEFYNKAISLDNNFAEAYMYRGALKIYMKKQSRGCADIKRAQNLGYEPAAQLLADYCQ
ncbi:MAG: tetratricopeptide (TPR) repeat protein [Marivirga sp.]